MNVLVIGLGSMGKRRIRCLQALGIKSINGFDPRRDRCDEAEQKYGVKCFTNFETAWAASSPNAAIISVPPDIHVDYMRICTDRNVPCFVEASVTSDGLADVNRDAIAKKLVIAPSATLCFHPAIIKIKEIVKSGELGKISNILFHSGQYLPDWHPYEKVSDFYVSKKSTGGAREILPFELTWLISTFGFPKRVAANVRKTINIEGAETIDDTYNCLMDFGDFLSIVTIDVVSRHAIRRLMINGDKKQLIWVWDEDCIRIYNPEQKEWKTEIYDKGVAAVGYNKNIGENMYIDEVKAFLNAVAGKSIFPNNLEEDLKVLNILENFEESDAQSRFMNI